MDLRFVEGADSTLPCRVSLDVSEKAVQVCLNGSAQLMVRADGCVIGNTPAGKWDIIGKVVLPDDAG